MKTNKDLLNEAIYEEMEKNDEIFIIGEEVGRSGGPHGVTKNLLDMFGTLRVVDAPISEIGFTGLAVGASYMGLHPIVDFMTWNFSLQAIDHIINSCAKTYYMSGGNINCPIVFRGPNGFNSGYAAQHTQDFGPWFGSIPGLKVVAPFTGRDHRGLLKSALKDKNPVIFLENEMLYDDQYSNVPDNYYQDLDKAIVEKQGSDITIIGISLSLKEILDAHEKLSKNDIRIEVINLVSIRPIDFGTIYESVIKTKRLIVVDFSFPSFSIASEIISRIAIELGNKMCIKCVSLSPKDIHTPYTKCLESLVYPTSDMIQKCAREMFNEK